MNATIIADLVKALEQVLDDLEVGGNERAVCEEAREFAAAALARAKQLDLDRAEVKFFFGSLSWPTSCKTLFKDDVQVLCIPLRLAPGDANAAGI